MAFHVQLARLRQGGGNFSVEDLRVVVLELWDRVEGLTAKPAPPAAPPAKDPYGGRRVPGTRDPHPEAP